MKIVKWGNSLAVRIPANVANSLELNAGDEIEIVASAVGFEAIKNERKSKALKTIARFQGRLPKDLTFDQDELSGR